MWDDGSPADWGGVLVSQLWIVHSNSLRLYVRVNDAAFCPTSAGPVGAIDDQQLAGRAVARSAESVPSDFGTASRAANASAGVV